MSSGYDWDLWVGLWVDGWVAAWVAAWMLRLVVVWWRSEGRPLRDS